MKNIYLLKDLSRRSGQSVHTIKYYAKIGLLKEIGRSPETNFRFFDDAALDQLKEIRAMRLKRLPLKEIRNRLSPQK